MIMCMLTYVCVRVFICMYVCVRTYSVGLERSSTGRTKVAVVLSCYDKGNKMALKQVADATLQTSIR